jgi:hypothetical protein
MPKGEVMTGQVEPNKTRVRASEAKLNRLQRRSCAPPLNRNVRRRAECRQGAMGFVIDRNHMEIRFPLSRKGV